MSEDQNQIYFSPPNSALLDMIASLGSDMPKVAFVPAGGAAPGGMDPSAGGAPPAGGDPSAGGGAPPPQPSAPPPPMDPAQMQQMQQMQMMQGGKGGGKKIEQQLLDAKINQILRILILMAQKAGITLDPSMLTPPQGDPMVEQQAQQEMATGSQSLPTLSGDGGGGAAGQQAAAPAAPPAMPTVAKSASYTDSEFISSVGEATQPGTYNDDVPAKPRSVSSLIMSTMKLTP